jgi:hypothetical protein
MNEKGVWSHCVVSFVWMVMKTEIHILTIEKDRSENNRFNGQEKNEFGQNK